MLCEYQVYPVLEAVSQVRSTHTHTHAARISTLTAEQLLQDVSDDAGAAVLLQSEGPLTLTTVQCLHHTLHFAITLPSLLPISPPLPSADLLRSHYRDGTGRLENISYIVRMPYGVSGIHGNHSSCFYDLVSLLSDLKALKEAKKSFEKTSEHLDL